MRKAIVLLAALGAAVAALAGSAGAITGNYSADVVHDSVGLLVFYTPNTPAGEDPFSHRCSGTLISPTVMVTAGHCTEGVDEGRVYFEQSAAPNYDPNAFGGRGGDPTTGYPYENGITFHRADNYGFLAGFPETKDAGVVVLDTPVTPKNGFGILPSAGAIDRYIAAAGNKKQAARFTTSGYGLSDQDPRPVSFRARLTATSYAVNNEAPITEFNLKTTANASQGKGGTCNGDSGGPVFFYGTNVIAAVTSFGMNGQCKGLDFSYRLDRPEVLSWINDPNRVDAG
ncbi:MAG: trypsin-like serine protease [Thermoleophilia bacterium]|nr:trypsin-like serine protease [Thermoleophilia bacterium]